MQEESQYISFSVLQEAIRQARYNALKGFDKRNIYRMVEFYEKYRSSAFVALVRPQIQDSENQLNVIVASMKPQLEKQGESELVAALRRQILGEDIRQTILSKIGWTHNKTIFSRCRTEEERAFYLRLCSKENYSVKELERQIDSGN